MYCQTDRWACVWHPQTTHSLMQMLERTFNRLQTNVLYPECHNLWTSTRDLSPQNSALGAMTFELRSRDWEPQPSRKKATPGTPGRQYIVWRVYYRIKRILWILPCPPGSVRLHYTELDRLLGFSHWLRLVREQTTQLKTLAHFSILVEINALFFSLISW